jgi:two-component system alkaline phosphatase synthesis response regulator PhoP
MSRVLVVEDDEAMAVALRDGFTYEGYEVAVARDGEVGLRLAREETPDLMILDVMLPKMTGLEICKILRGEGSRLPIIMLTARGQEIDKVLGLKLGADDYVTKPFSFMELMARVEAVLRRTQPDGGTTRPIHEFGDVTIDLDRHEAGKAGESLDLTPREFRLLGYFLEHRGEVISREELLDAVWGYDTIPFTRTVDTHIAKLRKKIEEDASDPQHIITVHRLGYKFVG